MPNTCLFMIMIILFTFYYFSLLARWLVIWSKIWVKKFIVNHTLIWTYQYQNLKMLNVKLKFSGSCKFWSYSSAHEKFPLRIVIIKKKSLFPKSTITLHLHVRKLYCFLHLNLYGCAVAHIKMSLGILWIL